MYPWRVCGCRGEEETLLNRAGGEDGVIPGVANERCGNEEVAVRDGEEDGFEKLKGCEHVIHCSHYDA